MYIGCIYPVSILIFICCFDCILSFLSLLVEDIPEGLLVFVLLFLHIAETLLVENTTFRLPHLNKSCLPTKRLNLV